MLLCLYETKHKYGDCSNDITFTTNIVKRAVSEVETGKNTQRLWRSFEQIYCSLKVKQAKYYKYAYNISDQRRSIGTCSS